MVCVPVGSLPVPRSRATVRHHARHDGARQRNRDGQFVAINLTRRYLQSVWTMLVTARTCSARLRKDRAPSKEGSNQTVVDDYAYRYERCKSLILCSWQNAIRPQGLPVLPDPNGITLPAD
jgi:uncharacterized protein YbbK (DUF523 family)